MSVEESFLQAFANSLGVSYKQLAEDYTLTQRAEILERYRAYRAYEAQQLELVRRWFRPFYDRIFMDVTFDLTVMRLCGYNPQKLLPGRLT